MRILHYDMVPESTDESQNEDPVEVQSSEPDNIGIALTDENNEGNSNEATIQLSDEKTERTGADGGGCLLG
ncbi:MAG: hypothetical protein HQL32_04210 [Planctomycetes bacterium]|nr:hypothetical protein [Planctomycetota bacterium]